MRVFLICLSLAGLAACSPTVPDSAGGVGFDDYDAYLAERQARERALAQSRQQEAAALKKAEAQEARPTAVASAPAATPVRTATTSAAQTSAQTGAQTSAQTRAQSRTQSGTQTSAQSGTRTVAVAPQATAPTAPSAARPSPAPQTPAARQPAPVAVNNPGISDEQDFAAVSARETIESDRERLKQQRAQYQEFQPTAVPAREGGGRPNIVEYALSTRHDPGQMQFRRTGFRPLAKNERNCAKYGSPDIAQEAFLANGGPRKDRENLDPDGDGFACGWDPRPYRNAVKH